MACEPTIDLTAASSWAGLADYFDGKRLRDAHEASRFK